MNSFANEITLLECESAEPKRLVHRKVIFDKTNPNFLKCLVDEGIAPQVLHWGEDYRIEEYIDSKTLTIFDLMERNVFSSMIGAVRGLN